MDFSLKPSTTLATGMGLYPWYTTFCRLESQYADIEWNLQFTQDTRVHDFTKNTQDYTRLYYRLHNYIVIILFDSNASCWAETKNSWDSRCPDTLNQYLTNIFITVWFHPMPKKDMEENMLRRSCSTVRDWY